MNMQCIMSKASIPQLSLVGSKMTTLEPIGCRSNTTAKTSSSDHSLSNLSDKGFAVLPHIRLASQLGHHSVKRVNGISSNVDARLLIRDNSSVLSTFRGECWGSVSPTNDKTVVADPNDCSKTTQKGHHQCFSLTTENTTDSHLSDVSVTSLLQDNSCSKDVGVAGSESNHNTNYRRDKKRSSQSLTKAKEEILSSPSSTNTLVPVKMVKKKQKKKLKNHRNKIIKNRSAKHRKASNVDDSKPHKHHRHSGHENSFHPQIVQVVPTLSKSLPKPKISFTSAAARNNTHILSTQTKLRHDLQPNSNSTQSQVSAGQLASLIIGASSPRNAQVKNDHSQNFDSMKKIIKVYCSDKQSGLLKELGQEFPCAPPASPMPVLLQHYEYIPSMNDVRAQRALKVQLEAMYKVEKKNKEKLKEEKHRKQKVLNKEKENDIRRQQRQEIYALNKVMTALEHSNFMDFCNRNGLNT